MNIRICCILFFTIIILRSNMNGICQSAKNTKSYQGKPFHDSHYNGGAQTIPGRLQCEYFDFGGEGIAFHDSDSINSGSGRLNHADGSYLHEFRINEAVDISFTKFQNPPIDNHSYC